MNGLVVKLKNATVSIQNYFSKINPLYAHQYTRIELIPFMTRLAGGMCFTLGLAAILGWYTDNYILYQIRPTLTPMYFNTALNFTFLGLGMILLVSKYIRWSVLLGFILITISGLTLIEYTWNMDIGIDTLFFKTTVSINTVSPGRSSPNSSASFLACGLALILLSFQRSLQFVYYVALALAIGVLVIASTSLLGYAADLSSTYAWAKLTSMALHTSVGLMIASGGLIAFVYTKDTLKEINLSSKSPYLAAVFVVCLTSLLWKSSLQQGMERLNELVSLQGDKMEDLITKIVEERVSDLEELKIQLQDFPEIADKLWLMSVGYYTQKNPFFKTIEWVDSNYKIKGIAPEKRNKQFLKKEIPNLTFLQKDLKIAKTENSIRISNIFQLGPNERGFYIIVPLYHGAQFKGYIVASTDIDLMLKDILKEVQSSKYEIAFFEGKNQKMSFFKSTNEIYQRSFSVKNIPLHNALWTVKVWPSTELFNKYEYTLLSKLIVIAGLLLALLLFSAIRARQIINKQAFMLRKTKKNLKLQLLESSRHTKELRLLKDMTDAVQICSSLSEASKPIASHCELLLPSTSGILYLTKGAGKKLYQFASWGKPPQKSPSIPVSSCIALHEGLASYRSGDKHDDVCQHLTNLTSLTSHSVNQCLPILDQSHILGLLSINNYNKLLHADPDDKRTSLLLETLTNQLSLSISGLKMRDLLRDQAIRDPLTNLYNRRYLEETLQQELYKAQRDSSPVSIIMIDIDHFKKINDTFGHEIGDQALSKIGLLLQKHYRKSDVACRFGGEEFILVLPGMSLDIATQRAEQIRLSATDICLGRKGKDTTGLTVSLGIATFPRHGKSMQALICAADKALYKAKHKGRNRLEVAQKDPALTVGPTLEVI